MKKKILILSIFGLCGAFGFSGSQNVEATETVPCGNALIDYKKAAFSTNCKQKTGYTCLIRCSGPKIPDIGL
jgi:hypothetical protein